MQIKKAPVKDLVSPEWNPRQITTEELEKLKTSLEEFGYIEPIIVNDVNNHVVGGNQRLRALIALGYDEVDCVYVHITDINKEKACNVALNKISGDWDEDKLRVVLEDIELSPIDIKLTGFDELELTELEVKEPITVHEDDFIIEDEEDMEVNVKEGDLFKLGEHYLLCGDSTNEANVKKLMQGAEINMVFTDPPYNINYSGIKDKRTIKNDKMEDNEFVDFLKKSLPYCDTAYICCSWQYAHLFKEAMNQLNMPPKAMIIWDKVNPAQNLDKYYKQHEIIWYYGKFGGEKTIRGDIWECKRQPNTFHPTMKPIELISMAIQDNPNKQNIYDGFGGSGSTLIACEQLNRNCYMMELDPYYCQVIINRWEEYTGQKAEKLPL